jgi:hypothetical protein
MPAQAINNRSLCEELKKQGFKLPPDCYDVTFQAGRPGDAIQINYHCFMTPDTLIKFGRALCSMGGEVPGVLMSTDDEGEHRG